MSAHDRHLAAHSVRPVDVECQNCGEQFHAIAETEYGATYLRDREDCPQCGATGDDLDVEDAEPPDPYDTREERDDDRL